MNADIASLHDTCAKYEAAYQSAVQKVIAEANARVDEVVVWLAGELSVTHAAEFVAGLKVDGKWQEQVKGQPVVGK